MWQHCGLSVPRPQPLFLPVNCFLYCSRLTCSILTDLVEELVGNHVTILRLTVRIPHQEQLRHVASLSLDREFYFTQRDIFLESKALQKAKSFIPEQNYRT